MNVGASILHSLLLWAVVNGAHVTGHLIAAGALGISVNRVSWGVGPTLCERTIGRVRVRLALLPVALLVRLRRPWRAEDPSSWPPPDDDPRDFRNRGRWARLIVVCAAPTLMLLVAFGAAYYQNSLPAVRPSKALSVRVAPGFPAAKAGMRDGDRILALEGKPVRSWREVQRRIRRSGGRAVTIDVSRAGSRRGLAVTPRRGEGGTPWFVGIALADEVVEPVGPWRRVGAALSTIGAIGVGLFRELGVFFGDGARETLAGPLFRARGPRLWPAKPTIESARRRFAAARAVTTAFLGYLALCLLPFAPYLDGRRLLFLAVEAALRRPIHPRFEQGYNRVCLALVVLLVLWIVRADVLRYLGG